MTANRAKLLEEFLPTAPEVKEIDSQIKSLEDSLANATEKAQAEIQAYRGRTADNLLKVLETQYRRAQEKENKIRSAFNVQFQKHRDRTPER